MKSRTVVGNNKAKRLVIDEGVFFVGNCFMTIGTRKIPPAGIQNQKEPVKK